MPAPPPAKKPGPDMMKMCSDTVDEIASLDLSGDAFEQAASDVCSEELTKTMGKTPKVISGCNFFAKKLAGVYNSSSFDKNNFCSALAGHTASAKATPTKAVVETHMEKKVSRHASTATQKKKTSLVTKKKAPATQNGQGEEEFLNNFLDDYDADQDKQKKAKVVATKKKADELFG